MLPALLLFATFSVYPLIYGVLMSVTRNTADGIRWVGLLNFKRLITGRVFPVAMRNTLTYVALTVPVMVTVPLALAVAAHGMPRLSLAVRFCFFMPVLSTGVVMSLIWRWIFAPGKGLVNTLLAMVGIDGPVWLGMMPWALIACVTVLWYINMGGNLILYTVAIEQIPRETWELAQMDGCSAWRRFWAVLMPSVAPMVGICTLLGMLGMMQVWMVPHLLTSGGPAYGTMSLVLDLYNNAFLYGDYGQASAEGVVLMLICGVLAFVHTKWVRRLW